MTYYLSQGRCPLRFHVDRSAPLIFASRSFPFPLAHHVLLLIPKEVEFLTAEALVFFLYYIYCGTIEGYGREASARNIVKVLQACDVFGFPHLRGELLKLV